MSSFTFQYYCSPTVSPDTLCLLMDELQEWHWVTQYMYRLTIYNTTSNIITRKRTGEKKNRKNVQNTRKFYSQHEVFHSTLSVLLFLLLTTLPHSHEHSHRHTQKYIKACLLLWNYYYFYNVSKVERMRTLQQLLLFFIMEWKNPL